MKQSDLISELDALIEEADTISSSGADHEDPRFRKWRHTAESTIEAAKKSGLDLPGEFKSSVRAYRAMRINARFEENVAALRSELQDSIHELQFIADHFRKYGASKSVAGNPIRALPLPVPERVSVAWLWHNVPVSLWFKFGGVLLTAFLLGVAAGQSGTYKSAENFVRTVFADKSTK